MSVSNDMLWCDPYSALAGVGDLLDAMDVVVKKGSTSPNLMVAVQDITDGKHLLVVDDKLNSLDDGTWTIQLRNVRDEIGNFYDDNTNTKGVEHYEWTVELR